MSATKYSVNRDQATWRILDGEAVVINNVTSYYYSLNKTGTYVWQLLLDDELTLEDVVERVSRRYRKSGGEVRAEVQALLEELDREGLVRGR